MIPIARQAGEGVKAVNSTGFQACAKADSSPGSSGGDEVLPPTTRDKGALVRGQVAR